MKKITTLAVLLLGMSVIMAGCGKNSATNEENTENFACEVDENGNCLDENAEEVVNEPSVEFDLGESENFTEEDILTAFAVVTDTIDNVWSVDVDLQKVWYAGDEKSLEEGNYYKSSDASNLNGYDEYLLLYSNFHTPNGDIQTVGSFEPNYDYTDYKWTLGRNEGEPWTVVSNGY